jgi:hypothetical protein
VVRQMAEMMRFDLGGGWVGRGERLAVPLLSVPDALRRSQGKVPFGVSHWIAFCMWRC